MKKLMLMALMLRVWFMRGGDLKNGILVGTAGNGLSTQTLVIRLDDGKMTTTVPESVVKSAWEEVGEERVHNNPYEVKK